MNTRVRRFLGMLFSGCVLWLGGGQAALAATACVGTYSHAFTLFNPMDVSAGVQSTTWMSAIVTMVTNTFKILATIELCWAASIWALEKDNLNSLAAEFIKKIMFIFFFYTLLQYAPSWIPMIIDSFQTIGTNIMGANAPGGTPSAGGGCLVTEPLSTDWLIAKGLATCDMIWGHCPKLNFFNIWENIPKILIAGFVCLGVMVCYLLMAAEYLSAKLESYILLVTGAVFLGFGASTWTKDKVTKYIDYAFGVGVRLLVMMIVIAIFGEQFMPFKWDYGPLFEWLGICVVMCVVFQKAPQMTNALLNGGTGMTGGALSAPVKFAGSQITGGQGIQGAARTLGGLATAAGGAAKGMAQKLAGGAVGSVRGLHDFGKAVAAGTQIARQEGKNTSQEGEAKGGKLNAAAANIAAGVSGLGKAAGAVAKETAKSVPQKLANILAIGPNSGPTTSARERLEQRAAAGAGQTAGGSGGTTGGQANSASGTGSQSAQQGNSSQGTRGDPGQTGQTGQTGQPGQSGQAGQNGQPGATGQSTSTGAGSESLTGHSSTEASVESLTGHPSTGADTGSRGGDSSTGSDARSRGGGSSTRSGSTSPGPAPARPKPLGTF